MNKKTFSYLIFFCILLSIPIISLAGDYTVNGRSVHFEGLVPCGKAAASAGETSGTTLSNPGVEMPCQLCHVFVMLNQILIFGVTYIVAPLAILLIAWGGIQIFFAGAKPAFYRAGINTIVWVAVGIAVILGAYIIVNIFFTFIGVADWTGLRGGWFQINCGGFGM